MRKVYIFLDELKLIQWNTETPILQQNAEIIVRNTKCTMFAGTLQYTLDEMSETIILNDGKEYVKVGIFMQMYLPICRY